MSFVVLVVAACTQIVFRAAALAAPFEGPDGFEKAKFGMSDSDFAKVYPSAKAASPTPAPDDPNAAYGIAAFTREDIAVGPMKNCRASYRFYRHELYDIQFVCPEKERIGEYLQSRFGTPNNTTPTALMWAGTTHGVSHVPKAGVFSFHDIPRAQAAQGAILRMMGRPAVTPGAAQ